MDKTLTNSKILRRLNMIYI